MEHETQSYWWARLCVRVRTPGTAYTDDLDISGLYDLSQPGNYTAQVSQFDYESKTWVKSNAITVTVVPDETALPTPPTSRAPFSLTIWLDRPGADYQFPFRLYIITKNISAHTITLQSAKEESTLLAPLCEVDVLDGDGYPPPKMNLGRSVGNVDQSPSGSTLAGLQGFCGRPLTLDPGEAWRDAILVNSLYQLVQPGEYTLRARRWDRENKTWVKSNKITDTIAPWNALEP